MKILVFNGSMGIKKPLDIIIESAKENGIKKIVCLGDLIGLGDDNRKCIDIVKKNEIQLISGTFEAILTQQIDTKKIDTRIISIMEKLKKEIPREDLIWMSNLKRLTILEDLLFMYGNYIDRYALFSRESQYKETDIITRKKHPLLKGIIIGSTNQQQFYNGKRLIQIRTKREYEYSEITNAKFLASPGRLFSIIRGNVIKCSWMIVDTEKEKINFIVKKIPMDNDMEKMNSYDFERIFALY